MSTAQPRDAAEECVYIDLDEKTPWWASLIGIVAVVLIVAVLIAPWAISLEDDQPDVILNNTMQNTGSVCRPDAADLPAIFDPSVASWSRLCEWFIAPDSNNPD